MLSLHLSVPALRMGGPLLLARPSTLRVPAPTAAEIWVEPPNINLLTESLEQQVASSRGSTPPMILWAPMPQSQAGSEAPAPPPHGANTGVASWYAHTMYSTCALHVHWPLHVHTLCMYGTRRMRGYE